MRRADGRPAGNGKHKTGTGIAGRPVRDLLVDYLGNARYNQLGVAVLRLPGQTVSWPDIETHHPGVDSLRLPCEVADDCKWCRKPAARRAIRARADALPAGDRPVPVRRLPFAATMTGGAARLHESSDWVRHGVRFCWIV